MKPEEIIEKDWQLLTAYSEMATITYLETILHYQAIILSELKNKPLETIKEEISDMIHENNVKVQNRVKKNIPKNSDRK